MSLPGRYAAGGKAIVDQPRDGAAEPEFSIENIAQRQRHVGQGELEVAGSPADQAGGNHPATAEIKLGRGKPPPAARGGQHRAGRHGDPPPGKITIAEQGDPVWGDIAQQLQIEAAPPPPGKRGGDLALAICEAGSGRQPPDEQLVLRDTLAERSAGDGALAADNLPARVKPAIGNAERIFAAKPGIASDQRDIEALPAAARGKPQSPVDTATCQRQSAIDPAAQQQQRAGDRSLPDLKPFDQYPGRPAGLGI